VNDATPANRPGVSKREVICWFLAALVVKGAYLLVLGDAPRLRGDAIVYVESIENLVMRGTYAWDLTRTETFAARMPGMFLPYGFLRLFFSPVHSQALQQCAQAILDSAAVVALLSFALRLKLGLPGARVVTLIYLLSTLVSSWNDDLTTESLAASGAFLGIWLCAKGAEERSRSQLVLGALLLAWVGFLKAFYFGWIAAVATSIAWVEFRRNRRDLVSPIKLWVAILLPFLVLVSVWTARNGLATGRFVPLQDGINGGYLYPAEFSALRSYMRAVGGDFVSWNPKAEVRWFDPWAGQTRPQGAEYPPDEIDLPRGVVTEACDRRKLLAVRNAYRTAQTTREESLKRVASAAAVNGLLECRAAFIEERPWDYRVVAPLKLLLAYVGHSGTYDLFPRPFSQLTPAEKFFKVAQSSLHLGAVLFGISGALWILASGLASGHPGLPVAVAALGHALGFPLILRLAEYRYLVMGYPLLFLCAGVVISAAFDSHRRNSPRNAHL